MTVDELKELFNVVEDQDLGPLFGRGKAAVSAWRKSGVPASIELKALELYRERLIQEPELTPRGNVLQLVMKNKSAEGCRRVDIFSMVSGGPGSEPEWHEPIGQEVVPEKWLSPSIRPIMDRAVIGVDTTDKMVISGEIYAVMLPYEGAAVKRLYILPHTVVIRSDNKDFPEASLRREEIGDNFILGRVKWVLQEY